MERGVLKKELGIIGLGKIEGNIALQRKKRI
jgi:hypothetical protein